MVPVPKERAPPWCRGRDHGHTAPEHTAAWLWIISDPGMQTYKINGHLEAKARTFVFLPTCSACQHPCRRQRAHPNSAGARLTRRVPPSSPILPTAILACQAKARTRRSPDRALVATRRCISSRTSQDIPHQSSRRRLSRRRKSSEPSRAR